MSEENRFDQAAEVWDSFEPRVKMIRAISQSIFERVQLNPKMDVLDFGCGTGLLSLRVADQVKSLTGIDTSAGMLKTFEQKAAQMGLKNTRTQWLDLTKKMAIPGQYDLIVSSMVFHHVKELNPVLVLLHSALKPGGQLRIADLDPDGGLFHENAADVFHNGFHREAFAAALKTAGFSSVELTDATSITKPVGDNLRTFSIFLATGEK
ncbi:MAG: class I SAM-dependent methyltransferase [Pontiellaceae bacterium]|nr:class I SAM-dependent methyltransferase [Pontiellaceae bacterium]